MKKSVILLSMGMLAMVAGADTVNFTAGEGYTTPGALTNYAGWNGNASFTVNTNGTGTVEWGNTASAQVNYETATLASALTIETSVQFRMKQATGYTSGSRMAAGIALNPNSTDSSQVFNDVRAYVNRTSATAYQLVLQNSTTGTYNPRILGSGFNESGLGLDGLVGDDSDLLEITLVLNRGATETNWTANAILKNVTTGATVHQILDYAIETPISYFEAPLYGSILAGTTDTLLGMTRQIDSFSIIPDYGVTGTDTVDFTISEGYDAPVPLADYDVWDGHSSFTVNTNGTGTVEWGNTAGVQVNYKRGVAASAPMIETSVQFRLTQAEGYTSGIKTAVGIALNPNSTDSSQAFNDVRAYVNRTSTNVYQLALQNSTTGTFTPRILGVGFNESGLGLDGLVGDDSDLLEITLGLNRGATETNWTANAILRNMTTGEIVYQILDYAIESPSSYFENPLYGSILSGTTDTSLGMTRQIDSFSLFNSINSSSYELWSRGWGVEIGSETNDYDEDGLNNLYEYGLGGDPTDALDQGTAPMFDIVDVGGTNYFGYVHPQLSDPNSGLIYSLELNTDLIFGTWTNVGYAVLGTNVTGNDLDFVTNVTDTVDGQKFIRLIIE